MSRLLWVPKKADVEAEKNLVWKLYILVWNFLFSFFLIAVWELFILAWNSVILEKRFLRIVIFKRKSNLVYTKMISLVNSFIKKTPPTFETI